MTRFGEKILTVAIFERLFRIWQNFEPTYNGKIFMFSVKFSFCTNDQRLKTITISSQSNKDFVP